jgi:hypothetical protein
MTEIKKKFLKDVQTILHTIEDGVIEILQNPVLKDEEVPLNPYESVLMMVETMYTIAVVKANPTGVKQIEDLLNALTKEVDTLDDIKEQVKEESKTGVVRVLKNDKKDVN